jgi:hypothetical protein
VETRQRELAQLSLSDKNAKLEECRRTSIIVA